MKRLPLLLCLTVVFLCWGGKTFAITEAKLLASDGAAYGYFGFSVSISGDVALVGAWYDDGNATDSGSAYVYRWNDTSWVEEQKLLASDGVAYDYFAQSVSISGNVALVGAPNDDDNGAESGSAYVYRWNGSNWVEEQKLLASDGAANDYFGWSVSVSGDVALVGATYDNDKGNASGSAYVFRWNGSSWVEEQKLLASDGAAYDYFGRAVSISGDVAVVGAPNDDDKGYSSGSTYIYRWNGSSWVEEQKLLASDGAADDAFGWSVSVSGDVALVGTLYGDGNTTYSGSAYVYRWNGSSWVEEQKLFASDGADGDSFGISVSISGNVALVGAAYNDSKASNSGSAYVCRWNGSSWVEEQKLFASDGADGDFFGRSVSVSADLALVGAYFDDDKETNSGSAYVFKIAETTTLKKTMPWIHLLLLGD